MSVDAGRALFVWYRVAREHEALAVDAVRGLQAQCEGLRCELLRREERSGEVTLMETYRAPGGVSAQQQARIEQQAATLMAPWLIGARRVEAFEACR